MTVVRASDVPSEPTSEYGSPPGDPHANSIPSDAAADASAALVTNLRFIDHLLGVPVKENVSSRVLVPPESRRDLGQHGSALAIAVRRTLKKGSKRRRKSRGAALCRCVRIATISG
jgi:hypothetical protein